jgi:hypothetical protein
MLYGKPGGEGQGGGKGLGGGGGLTAGNASKHNPHYMLTRFFGASTGGAFCLAYKCLNFSLKTYFILSQCTDKAT